MQSAIPPFQGTKVERLVELYRQVQVWLQSEKEDD